MNGDQADANASYQDAVTAARRQLDHDIEVAGKTYDAQILAATSEFTARERAARSAYWSLRADSWRTFGATSGPAWQQDTLAAPALPEGRPE